ncbi:MAG: archaemetzincin family Zn-dependent metalloprotease [Desulfosoma sp.]|uniref:archaemetzincin family Zn-dependent metalloprotease n=1 Tax=Desulfosoma sp. TaxID=2603217 RepID=UPI0040495DE0
MRAAEDAEGLAEGRLHAAIAVVPMGDVGEAAVRIVAANIQAVLGLPTDRLPRIAVPEACYVPERRQYDAAGLIGHLQAWSAGLPYLKVLALLAADMGVPILRFVFGEAQLGGRCAVVSAFRLRRNPDGTDVGLEHSYERLAKVALHETGHTFSLFHCDDPGCLMHFAPSVEHLDRIRLFFCSRCDFLWKETRKSLAMERALGKRSTSRQAP